MTAFCESSPALRGLLLTGNLILCFAGIFHVMAVFLQRRGPRKILVAAALLAGSYTLFQLQFYLANCMSWHRPIPRWSSLPVATLVLPLATLTILTGAAVANLFRWQKGHLDPGAAKESINQLPTGLCFCSGDGAVLLSNRRMEQLCRAATGEALLDACAFWDEVGQSGFCHTDDGSVWSMDRQILHTELGEVYQITAVDVTRQHVLSRELEQDRLHLKDRNLRLRQYGKTVENATREKELLAAKIRVHDDLGRCLLAAKRCMLTPVTPEDKAAALELWRQTIALIQAPPEQGEEADSFDDLFAAAKAVGVSIVLSGTLPPVGTAARALTESAVHECLTNTVRHARGNELYVEMSHEKQNWVIRCTNNGIPPGEPVREGGGLSSLRRQVEQAGGIIQIETAPRFTLTLTIEEETAI